MVSGIEYTAQVQASNKKDAQSRAAWDFCENLVKTGYMKQSELPPKPVGYLKCSWLFGYLIFEGY